MRFWLEIDAANTLSYLNELHPRRFSTQGDQLEARLTKLAPADSSTPKPRSPGCASRGVRTGGSRSAAAVVADHQALCGARRIPARQLPDVPPGAHRPVGPAARGAVPAPSPPLAAVGGLTGRCAYQARRAGPARATGRHREPLRARIRSINRTTSRRSMRWGDLLGPWAHTSSHCVSHVCARAVARSRVSRRDMPPYACAFAAGAPQHLVDLFTYRAVRTVLEQLYETDSQLHR